MSNETKLASVWASVESLIDDGISIMPVYDRAVGNKNAKDPCLRTWKALQSERMDKGELWQAMQTYDTTAVAAITGEVSGRLELIDVDSKYEPGIEALLLKDIEAIYPHIYPRLRIHATPSGGRHIIYRIEDGDVPGSQKLAGREKTQEEFQDDRKRTKQPSRTVNFLETRGEGGYFLYPPSMGYTVIQDVPIPLLTWEERCGLINLCKSYDRIVKVEPTPRPTKKEDDWYTTNPFEHFNQTCDPIVLMEEFGWKALPRHDNRFIWFTRPGKEQGISASFNQSKRVFWIFTSSTDLENEKGYNPASMLAILKFQGDKKKTFRHLVDSGYGKVKRSVEQAVIKKAVMSGKGIPENFSDEGKNEYNEKKEKFKGEFQYGVFWFLNSNGNYEIEYDKLLYVAEQLGYRRYNGYIVRVDGPYVGYQQVSDMITFIKGYIKDDKPEEESKISSAYEKFMQKSGKYIGENRLEEFDDTDCIHDDQFTCWKFFQNIAVRITSSDLKFIEYSELEKQGLIWKEKIIQRDYNFDVKPSALFQEYLRNATGVNSTGTVKEHVRNVIGFLCHDFNSPTDLYIIVMTEMVSDPKKGGGSGKNILVNILDQVIGVSTASGSMVSFDDRFYSVWNPQDRIYFIPDIPRKINWEFLKSAIEDPKVNKKYVAESTVYIEDAPKIVINTNHSYMDSDGGLKRRIVPLEFTDFYTLNHGIKEYHGKVFPGKRTRKPRDKKEDNGFDESDWRGFFDFIIHSIKIHLEKDRKLDLVELSETGWTKKFINTYGEDNYDFIRDNIVDWINVGTVKVNEFQASYDNFMSELKERYKLGKKMYLAAVEEFCEHYGIIFTKGVKKREAHTQFRAHIFEGDSKVFCTNDEIIDDGVAF